MTITKKQAHAYHLVQRALISGELPAIKDCLCQKCNQQATEYHHPDYDEPLNVMPLCMTCHKQEHVTLRAAGVSLNAGTDVVKDTNVITVNVYTRHVKKLEIIMQQTGMSRSEIMRRLVDSAYAQPSVVTATEELSARREPEPA